MRASPLSPTPRMTIEPGSGGGSSPPPAEDEGRQAHHPAPFSAPPTETPAAWGSSEQIAAARQNLEALLHGRAAREPTTLLHRVALVLDQQGPTPPHDPYVLALVRRICEQSWRRPVVSEFVLRRLVDRDLFAAWKTLDLLRYGRTPAEVSEGFVRAAGDVGDVQLVSRDVFWQRFKPLSHAQTGLRPSGKVVLMAPGLGETGRNFYEQAMQLCRLGHEVLLMDQQWAGQTRNSDGTMTPGALDCGFGAARDICRVAEHAHRHLLPDQHLVLLGQGTGGAAILLLLVAQAAGRLETSLPKNIDAVLQAPYLAPTPTGTNKFLGLLGRLPLGRSLPAGHLLPKPSSDLQAAKGFAQCRQRDNVQVLLGTMTALRQDLATMWALLAEGYKPRGRVAVLHSADDPWADPAASWRLSRKEILGSHAAVRILSGAHHALGHVASERNEALWGLHKLAVMEQHARADNH